MFRLARKLGFGVILARVSFKDNYKAEITLGSEKEKQIEQEPRNNAD